MTSTPSARVRKIASLSARVVLSLVVFLGFGEILARRLSFIDRLNTFPRQLYLPTSATGLAYTLRPGVRVSRQSRDGEYEVRVNRLGFRGPEVSDRPPEGVHRVLVLGDSVAFGEGLAESDTFPVRLEAALNRGRSAARYEVINAGVSGYNTTAEAALLRHRGMQLQPQTILLAVSFNDFGPTPVINERGVLSHSAARRGRWERLLDRSEFVLLLRWMFTWARGEHPFQKMAAAEKSGSSEGQLRERLDAAVAARHQHFYRNPRGSGWQDVREALVEIRDLAADGQSRLLVVLFPEGFQITEEQGRDVDLDKLSPQRAWLQLCDELRLACLDLRATFQSAPQRPLFLDVQHPNAAGHRLAARATAAILHGHDPEPTSPGDPTTRPGSAGHPIRDNAAKDHRSSRPSTAASTKSL